MTNADRMRQMSDEELESKIYEFMGNAAACPDCFRRNGRERLRIWLQLEVKDETKSS